MSREKIKGVYSITNKVNGKIYIGETKDIEKKMGNTCKKSKHRHS